MLPSVPLPSWFDFLALFTGDAPDDQVLAAPWLGHNQRAIWFSRAAWAMERIVMDWRDQHDGATPNLWLPDYFCNQSTAPMRDAGAQLFFYPITRDLMPDWPKLEKSAATLKPDLFIIVHYFGYAIDTQIAKRFCDQFGAILIEDASHVLVPHSQIGTAGQFVFYSPYKFLPVPDGGLLLVRNKMTNVDLCTDLPPSTLAWGLKRVAQKTMPFLTSRVGRQPARFDEDPLFGSLGTRRALSPFARGLIGRAAPRMATVATERSRLAKRWSIALTKRDVRMFAPFNDPHLFHPAPYRQIADFGDSAATRQAYESLIDLGCPVETWPDLAPEVIDAGTRHRVAIALRESLLLLPVHADMDIEGFAARLRVD